MSELSLSEPGLIILFGSGETSPTGRKIFDKVFRALPHSPRLALLETPAGFELNSHQVIKRVGDFFSYRLQNYSPQVEIIPARKRNTLYSPDDPELVAPLLNADMIFLGPGSPSYAIHQLRDSLAWYYMIARNMLGGTIVLASAATIAFSSYALPVYEIYKVGEELHWIAGLNFFRLFGLDLIVIPHWNNEDGGDDLDTSYCFMGQERFASLLNMLPKKVHVVGLDEKTALIMDLSKKECHIQGIGNVTLLHSGQQHSPNQPINQTINNSEIENRTHKVIIPTSFRTLQFKSGDSFPINVLGDFHSYDPNTAIPKEIWNKAIETDQYKGESALQAPSAEILRLIQAREKARECGDWSTADDLRHQIKSAGWEVIDTLAGPISRRITE